MLLDLRSLWESSTNAVKDAGAIASAEAFGQPAITFRWAVVGAGGIASAEAFGADAFASHVAIVGEGGIPSAEAFGQPTITFRLPLVGAGGIASAEAFGQPTVTSLGVPSTLGGGGRRERPRRVVDQPHTPFVMPIWAIVRGAGGIESAEAFGMPRVIAHREPARRRREELAVV